MNGKVSVFVICVKAIIFLLLYNLHDCTFELIGVHFKVTNIFTEVSIKNTGATFKAIVLVFLLFTLNRFGLRASSYPADRSQASILDKIFGDFFTF